MGECCCQSAERLNMCATPELACTCRDALDQPMPVAAAANECFKAAKGLGMGDNDFAAVYEAVSKKP